MATENTPAQSPTSMPEAQAESQRRFNSELPETAVTELKIIALRQKTTFSKVLAEAAQEYIRRRPAVAA